MEVEIDADDVEEVGMDADEDDPFELDADMAALESELRALQLEHKDAQKRFVQYFAQLTSRLSE